MAGKFLIEFSVQFDPHKWSNDPCVDAAIENLLHEVIDFRESQGRRIRGREELRRHLKILVLDLYVAYKSRPFLYKSISRRPGSYTQRISRYKTVGLSGRYLIGLLDDLIALRHVKQYPGFYDRERGAGFLTRIRARRSLITMLEMFGVQSRQIHLIDRETVILRNANALDIEYEDDNRTNEMRSNLAVINSAIRQRRIRLHLPDHELLELSRRLANHEDEKQRGPIDYGRRELHRVFNNSSFEQGGRFYGGWWQTIPRDHRKYITIDYKNTIEIDFSGMHLRMLYSMEGVPVPDDPYDLPGFPREEQKQAIIEILNANSRDSAERSLRRNIRNVRVLTDALMAKHQPIQHHFFSGMGVHLQYLDSRIAELVMLKVIDLGGIALPVHDSFIVRIGREHELEQAMNDAFTVLFPNVRPIAKAKPTVLDDRLKSADLEDEIQIADYDLAEFQQYSFYYHG
jgi:hypothetical protein